MSSEKKKNTVNENSYKSEFKININKQLIQKNPNQSERNIPAISTTNVKKYS